MKNAFRVRRRKRVGDNGAVSLMTMDPSLSSVKYRQSTSESVKRRKLNDVSIGKDGYHYCRLDILLDLLPVKEISGKNICALHYWVDA